mmetsp:Transcript_21978/g.66040  ORF Transcript_21978/g.66040 Transcript_21978/m.66040 type:complete len:217 (-) Transcript_21978:302-952(-)
MARDVVRPRGGHSLVLGEVCDLRHGGLGRLHHQGDHGRHEDCGPAELGAQQSGDRRGASQPVHGLRHHGGGAAGPAVPLRLRRPGRHVPGPWPRIQERVRVPDGEADLGGLLGEGEEASGHRAFRDLRPLRPAEAPHRVAAGGLQQRGPRANCRQPDGEPSAHQRGLPGGLHPDPGGLVGGVRHQRLQEPDAGASGAAAGPGPPPPSLQRLQRGRH